MSMNAENSLKNTISNCLSQQISELELLQSMYPNTDEIILTDKKILSDIHNFINNKSEYTPNHLDFVLNLVLNGLKLEIFINLPSFYPEEEPDIYIRCNQLNRQQETSLNSELSNYLKSNHLGEVCLYTAISWLQENIDHFNNVVNDNKPNELTIEENLIDDKFVRFWIYSHHIYNKKKREEILKTAKDLNLTGFCLPGKPGVICIEGLHLDCKTWWRYIKSLSWKKIMIRKTETFERSQQNKEQKFFKFEEIHFQNPTPRHKHSDMSGFSKYMEEHDLSQAFNEFFGYCNDN